MWLWSKNKESFSALRNASIGVAITNMRFFISRLQHSPVPRRAAIILVALALSSLAEGIDDSRRGLPWQPAED